MAISDLTSLFGKVGPVGTSVGGAVSDIFAAEGDKAEAQQYGVAAGLAGANIQYTEQMTAVKEAQEQRDLYRTIGSQQAGYAGGNVAASGSALDVLRSSIQQGSLQQYVLGAQGAAQEASYREQQQAYNIMQDAANNAAKGSDIAAGIKGATAVASLATLML